MMNPWKDCEIPGRVEVSPGSGGLPVIRVNTEWSEAEVFTHGAHIAGFRKKNEAPILFLSAESCYDAAKAIRGGVPVIFPWFGAREGMAAHGFARVRNWDWIESRLLEDGAVRLRFRLPLDGAVSVEYSISVGPSLTMEFCAVNHGSADFTFEICLHTYFKVGSIDAVSLWGLRGRRYRDAVLGVDAVEQQDFLHFDAETDRIYQDDSALLEIRDPSLGRVIRIRKSGAASTVVWNPWNEKSSRMADFGDLEYREMVCVESGNIGGNAVTLAPEQKAVMCVELDSVPL